MKNKVQKASEIFEEKLEGRGTTDVIHAMFKANGIFDDVLDDHKILQYEMEKTRKLLRRISVIIETGEEQTRIRGVHNLERWQNGEYVQEYVMLRKMTLEEVELVARKYGKTGRVYIRIEEKLLDVVKGQLLLFDLFKKGKNKREKDENTANKSN